MIAVIQRVSSAQVVVKGATVGRINNGLLVLAGFADGDDSTDCQTMASKIRTLRIFNDDHGKMNLDIGAVAGSVLAVSQFTLLADTRRGRRPSYQGAAPPQIANLLMNQFVECLKAQGLTVETGQFQAHMEVSLVNDGPVTILLDSKTWRESRAVSPANLSASDRESTPNG